MSAAPYVAIGAGAAILTYYASRRIVFLSKDRSEVAVVSREAVRVLDSSGDARLSRFEASSQWPFIAALAIVLFAGGLRIYEGVAQ